MIMASSGRYMTISGHDHGTSAVGRRAGRAGQCDPRAGAVPADAAPVQVVVNSRLAFVYIAMSAVLSRAQRGPSLDDVNDMVLLERRRDGKMIKRWCAAGMLNAERSFRRLKGRQP